MAKLTDELKSECRWALALIARHATNDVVRQMGEFSAAIAADSPVLGRRLETLWTSAGVPGEDLAPDDRRRVGWLINELTGRYTSDNGRRFSIYLPTDFAQTVEERLRDMRRETGENLSMSGLIQDALRDYLKIQ